ncbi:hypothetical protein A2382_01425 [Candidatus Woesebacteria bacterium RIFOXYB1_FULL_38_16]|uniref:Glycosyltransferase n=1 Tax=Candidatus Woesebacteria bacterium RIFOXYB1_FULL_38_16 TaxID=1802538 RepID=A0A1F8CTJ2_9BACT|nr:MAG: hypothetical protein A2382_01425 [Candidatus Woesebacteria bacterium RIFOXYB1_FULL_38_16]
MGGGETITYLMARHLSDLGHDVTVVTGALDDFQPYKPRVNTEKFKMKYIPGFEQYCVGRGDMVKPLSLIYDTLKKINPDIIHVHNLLPQYLLSPIVGDLNAKIVLSYHNTPNPPLRIIGQFNDYELDYAFASHIFKKTKYDSLVATSDFYKQWGIRLGAPSRKTQLIYSGIDVETFNPSAKRRRDYFRNKLGLNQNDILITLPSRVIKRKGIVEAMRALELLKIKYKDIKIFLPCLYTPFDLPFSRQILKLVKKRQLNSCLVHYKRHISFNEMPLVYAATDITITPSYYEGLGLCVLESLGMEVPVVGTDVSGINEIIVDNINGLLVPPRNYKKLANAISRLIDNKELSRRLATAGRKTVLERFNSIKMALELEHHYKYLLKNEN